ncbi:hypothetical protein BDU57DRAFT_522643 [Ampelomyces quisqualis]|uniref:Uncharacterized protein n=1 Tax=Ampelomyces quisqualis TaxID=50730 RepID=A0A6A5QAK0_AMPQU|nr:hypothetical protein BDU57DRAFT_522643 [Ampelomyces quisqualis]
MSPHSVSLQPSEIGPRTCLVFLLRLEPAQGGEDVQIYPVHAVLVQHIPTHVLTPFEILHSMLGSGPNAEFSRCFTAVLLTQLASAALK